MTNAGEVLMLYWKLRVLILAGKWRQAYIVADQLQEALDNEKA
jgi:hypothetical protein